MTSVALKSLVLRVAMTKPCSLAVAAIMESKAERVVPDFSAVAHMLAQYSAVELSKGRMRSAISSRILLTHSVSAILRCESRSLAIPLSNSASVIDDMNIDSSVCALIHAMTLQSGIALTSSDKTQVSSRYFTTQAHARALRSAQCPSLHRVVH